MRTRGYELSAEAEEGAARHNTKRVNMEKIKSIPTKDFRAGFFIEVECCMCGETAVFAEATKKWLRDKLKEEGWRELDSDENMVTGHYCGCNYLNTD